jgi:hypothetical protein
LISNPILSGKPLQSGGEKISRDGGNTKGGIWASLVDLLQKPALQGESHELGPAS